MENFSFRSSVKKYVNGSILLIMATVAALIVANLDATSEWYKQAFDQPVSLSVGRFNIFSHDGHPMTVGAFINDFLMAIFFLSVGLEIKREVLCGELSTVRKAMLPVIGACGGMIVPVIVFFITCSCPAASIVLNFAEIVGEGQKSAANLVLVSTLLSILTLPLMMLLLPIIG